MITLTQPNLSTRIDELEAFYQFEQKNEVLEFLKENREIISILSEGHDRIRNYFPNNDLILEYHVDPEIPDYQQLFLKIVTEGKSDEEIDRSLEIEKQLSYDWYLNLSAKVREIFCVSVE
ncbi:MAG: hypothetical protein J7647_08325 [Cyanobacteria bacterium SBLK]|nr:hypothetical protein [Cyanobacteria bacterium SBLK]